MAEDLVSRRITPQVAVELYEVLEKAPLTRAWAGLYDDEGHSPQCLCPVAAYVWMAVKNLEMGDRPQDYGKGFVPEYYDEDDFQKMATKLFDNDYMLGVLRGFDEDDPSAREGIKVLGYERLPRIRKKRFILGWNDGQDSINELRIRGFSIYYADGLPDRPI